MEIVLTSELLWTVNTFATY